MDAASLVLACVGVVLLASTALMYNALIARRNQVLSAEGSIHAYLKKRFDIIPNLIAAVQNYMAHEAQVLTEIVKLREQQTNSTIKLNQELELNQKLSSALPGFFLRAEQYPELKADATFLQFQGVLNNVENEIAAARRAYNAAVAHYNDGVEMIPLNLVALVMGWTTKEIIVFSEEEQQNPNIHQLFKRPAS